MNKERKFKDLSIGICRQIQVLIFAGVLTVTSHAQLTESRVTGSPMTLTAPTMTCLTGNIVCEIDFEVNDITAEQLLAYDMDVVYNSSIINPTGSNSGCTTVGTLGEGTTPLCNLITPGRIRVGYSRVTPIPGGEGSILKIKFLPAAGAMGGSISAMNIEYPQFFGLGGPINTLQVTNGEITMRAPTAATASLDGVVKKSSGMAVANAVIEVRNQDGTLVGVGNTNGFGRFQLSNLIVGQTYVINAKAKGLTFQPRLVNINDNISDFEMVSIE